MSQDKQIKNVKVSDNTAIKDFNRFTYPASSTSIDRYVFANTWTKGKTVLDAATGQGYGAGILLSLGAKSVVGIDTDEHAVEVANNLLQSPKANFSVCDIFDLEKDLKKMNLKYVFLLKLLNIYLLKD